MKCVDCGKNEALPEDELCAECREAYEPGGIYKMPNLHGMDEKFFIVKKEDLEKIDEHARGYFFFGMNEVWKMREATGKKQNRYIIINVDEPYIEDIIKILQKNGHWGERDVEPSY